MANNIEIINAAVTLIIKAAILASNFSGRVRKRSLKRLSKMDADDKDKEIIFLRDKVYQQQMRIMSITSTSPANQNEMPKQYRAILNNAICTKHGPLDISRIIHFSKIIRYKIRFNCKN